MKKTRVLAFCIAFTLLISVLAGCGTKDKNEESQTSTAATTTATTTATTEPTAAPEVKPALKFLFRDAAFDVTKDPTLSSLKALTGYDVVYEALPAGDEGLNKLMILVSSGEPYDLLKLNTTQFDRLVGSNALIDLGSLLDNFGSEIKKNIPDALMWQRGSIDGKVLGIPEITTGDGPQYNTIVRVDILKKLGLSMPATADEFYNVLKTVKEKEPGMVPYSLEGENGGYIIPNLMSAYGVPNLPWIDVNGTLVPLHKAPGFKEYFEFVCKLYAEGLMDKDMPALKQTQKQEKYNTGKAVMARIIWQEGMTIGPAIKKNLPESESDAMPFLKGNAGQQIADIQTGVVHMSAIPKSSKNSEHVIKLLNIVMETEKFKELAIGKEGEHFEVKDNQYFPLQPKFNEEKANAWWFAPVMSATTYPIYWEARVRRNADLLEWYNKTRVVFKDVPQAKKVDAFVPPIESIVKNQTVAGNNLRDELNKIVYGAVPIEDFEKALEKWENEGGAQMTADINAWYKGIAK